MFFDQHLKPVMENIWFCVKASGDILKKAKNVGSIPENAILVTADALGLYPNILHNAGLKLLHNMFESRNTRLFLRKIPLNSSFFSENKYFECNDDVKKQISGTAIGATFAPPYTCIFMNELETKPLQSQTLQSLV